MTFIMGQLHKKVKKDVCAKVENPILTISGQDWATLAPMMGIPITKLYRQVLSKEYPKNLPAVSVMPNRLMPEQPAAKAWVHPRGLALAAFL